MICLFGHCAWWSLVSNLVGGLCPGLRGAVVVDGAPEGGLALLERGNLLLQLRDGLVVVGRVAGAREGVAVASVPSNHRLHPTAQHVQDRDSEEGQQKEESKGDDDQGGDQVDRQAGVGEENSGSFIDLPPHLIVFEKFLDRLEEAEIDHAGGS